MEIYLKYHYFDCSFFNFTIFYLDFLSRDVHKQASQPHTCRAYTIQLLFILVFHQLIKTTKSLIIPPYFLARNVDFAHAWIFKWYACLWWPVWLTDTHCRSSSNCVLLCLVHTNRPQRREDERPSHCYPRTKQYHYRERGEGRAEVW